MQYLCVCVYEFSLMFVDFQVDSISLCLFYVFDFDESARIARESVVANVWVE